MKHWIHSVFYKILGAVPVLAVMAAFSTGWLYGLRTGPGIEQGQRPDGTVQQLRRKEDIEAFFLSSTPAAVTGGPLIMWIWQPKQKISWRSGTPSSASSPCRPAPPRRG